MRVSFSMIKPKCGDNKMKYLHLNNVSETAAIESICQTTMKSFIRFKDNCYKKYMRTWNMKDQNVQN